MKWKGRKERIIRRGRKDIRGLKRLNLYSS